MLKVLKFGGSSLASSGQFAKVKDIPVNIRNTNEPDAPGTIIGERFEDELTEEHERFITGIAGKKNFSIINIYKSRIGENKINTRTIEQGFDEINIMVGVYNEDFERAVKVLYDSFAR